MQKQKEQKPIWVAEISILVFIWLIIFTGPLIFENNSGNFNWQGIFMNWQRLIPFVLLTLFNHFVLVPFLFFKKRKIGYFVCSLITLIAFVYILDLVQKPHRQVDKERLNEAFRPPPPISNERLRFEDEKRPPRDDKFRPPKKEPGALPPYLNSILIAFFILGFDTGLRTVFKWTSLEREREVLEKEKVKAELAFLKNQVSPHFFMNTLNNIHALIDVNSEDAKESIIKLSKLMRYLLYDTELGKTTLLKEIEFIKSYVDLMKLRFPSEVKIELSFPEEIPDATIPPMLFISLVENAFKHGISYQAKSFLGIYLSITGKNLHFRIKNTLHKNREENLEAGGLGLTNLQKRLELLYGSSFSIDRKEDEEFFEIYIQVPL